jgi:tetratricopeptide (TPR) repeat protein
MSRYFSLVLLAILLTGIGLAQTEPQSPASNQQDSDQQTELKGKAARAKDHIKQHFKSWCIVGMCWNFAKSQDEAQPQAAPQNQAPPRPDRKPAGNDEESSSKDTKVDLTPPSDDATHPGSAAGSDVNEFHVYDPHKAEKDVEVGDFYFKRKNYKAAVNRYRSALTWKPNDAFATFRLAQALEKAGDVAEARADYEAYLKILPHGPNAKEAQQALERLTLQTQSRRDPQENRR